MLEFRSEGIHVQVLAPPSDAINEILTPDALRLIGLLNVKYNGRRLAVLAKRKCRAQEFDAGLLPTFLPPSPATQDPTWKCATIPSDIQDRRVEITGPVDRKMVINGLNSGANVYMAGTFLICGAILFVVVVVVVVACFW
jgi:malate synthase